MISNAYYSAIRKYKPLTRKQEASIAKRIRHGDTSAIKTIVLHNLRFALHVAYQYIGNGVPIEDLVSVSSIGLINAARRFDDRKNFKFISYAVWWIRQALLDHIGQMSRCVYVPLNSINLLNKVKKFKNSFENHYYRLPNEREISAATKIPLEKLKIINRFSEQPVRLDLPVCTDHPNPTKMIDFMVSNEPAPDAATTSNSDFAHTLIESQCLDNREREILRLYFGIGEDMAYNLGDIGARLGITRERVRQIKYKAIKKLQSQESEKIKNEKIRSISVLP